MGYVWRDKGTPFDGRGVFPFLSGFPRAGADYRDLQEPVYDRETSRRTDAGGIGRGYYVVSAVVYRVEGHSEVGRLSAFLRECG